MGDPKKQRKKYSGPTHPWQADRIKEEAELLKEYGLKNKKEIWKANSILRNFRNQAKRIIRMANEQAKKEEKDLMLKLQKLNFLKPDAHIENILDLTLKNILDRRLQTIIFAKGLSKTISQARQFITHKHILVGKKVITIPSYLVSAREEEQLSFIQRSPLSNPEHAERIQEKKE